MSKKQLKFAIGQEAEAQTAAIAMSMDAQGTGYAAVIASSDGVYVEDEPPVVRVKFERIIGEYEDGEQLAMGN